jgi:hypothetical protein
MANVENISSPSTPASKDDQSSTNEWIVLTCHRTPSNDRDGPAISRTRPQRGLSSPISAGIERSRRVACHGSGPAQRVRCHA